MKKSILYSTLILIILLNASCLTNKKLADAEVVITPLSDKVTIRDGSIVYGLPRSVLTVVVEMERTIDIPGPYSKYAGDLLGLDNVIQTENESWTIENISVRSSEELDPSEFYVIAGNTLFQTNVLALKKEGLILDLNSSSFNTTANKSGTDRQELNEFRSSDLGSDEYFLLQRDTAFRRVNVDSSFIRIPYIVEKKKKLPPDQLAEKAAKRLMEMRDGKHLILTGEANVFPQNESAINEMNRLEREYTELFTGKSIKLARTFTYQIIPLKEMTGKPVPLFYFSDATGPVTGNAQGGKPVMIEFIPEQKTKDLTLLNNSQLAPEAPKYDKLFYRVPDVVNLKINLGTEVLFNSRRLIYQFGQVVQLPANYLIGK